MLRLAGGGGIRGLGGDGSGRRLVVATLRRLQSTTARSSGSQARCFTNSAALFEKSKAKEDAVKPLGIPYDKLTVGIPKETFPLERRVAATPQSVANLVKPGFKVQVEDGAGMPSYFSNQDYQNAGATIVDDIWKTSDIVLKVRIADMIVTCALTLLLLSVQQMAISLLPFFRRNRSGRPRLTRPRRSRIARW
jgi:Alanine dehydrogenase/PNT, N-terminal domain